MGFGRTEKDIIRPLSWIRIVFVVQACPQIKMAEDIRYCFYAMQALCLYSAGSVGALCVQDTTCMTKDSRGNRKGYFSNGPIKQLGTAYILLNESGCAWIRNSIRNWPI